MTIVTVEGPSTPREIRKYLMRRTKDEIVSRYLDQWRYCGELESELNTLRNSIAHLKAQWQAEALEEAARMADVDANLRCDDDNGDWLRELANDCRRHADTRGDES